MSSEVRIFDRSKLDEYFKDMVRVESRVSYFVLNDAKTGSTLATISYSFHDNQTTWDICIDNFPRQKKYYKSNFPIKSIEEFKHEMNRIGLDLRLK